MVRQSRGRAVWQLMFLVMTVLAMTVPAAAQSGGGTVIGIVVDEDGQGVECATVVVEATERSRRMELTTNSNGEFRQIGLQNGPHRVSAEKDGVTAPAQTTCWPSRVSAVTRRLRPRNMTARNWA